MIMKNSKPFAEIIESSLTIWTAQSWEWNIFPVYGSLVYINAKDHILYGIVHHIQTGSMDPTRSPFPYKKTEEELLQEQPQIFEFLKTSFNCLTVGYQEKNAIHYTLAPTPPQIHAFVHNATPAMYTEFFNSPHFLHVLFNSSGAINAVDELLLALLQQQANQNLLKQEQLQKFIQLFSLLTGNDYRRLKLFLSRIEQNITI